MPIWRGLWPNWFVFTNLKSLSPQPRKRLRRTLMDKIQPKGVKGDLLIVDDDLSALQTLEALLSREGYEVRGAPNGQTALMFAREDPPELILLDIRLPDMDGFQVCRLLKADQKTGNIPVIFISGLDEVVDKVKGFATGGIDYITKPFH